MEEDKIKMYVIVAKESLLKMNGNRGKLAAQIGHAILHAYWDAENRFTNFTEETDYSCSYDYGPAQDYRASERAYKICLVVDTVEELKQIEAEYRSICGVSLVTDAGFTVFNEPTTTCLGIGPLRDSLKTDSLKNLKTLI